VAGDSGRFAILVADALSPQAQAKAIEDALDASYLQETAIAVRALRPTMTVDYVLDHASSNRITTGVEDAHDEVERFLRKAEQERILTTLRTGSVEEEDSRKVLGIQVADVAAAVASSIFERWGKPTREAACDLRDYFAGVFLNDAWL